MCIYQHFLDDLLGLFFNFSPDALYSKYFPFLALVLSCYAASLFLNVLQRAFIIQSAAELERSLNFLLPTAANFQYG